MAYLLNLLYLFLLIAVSPWLLWAALRHGKYRQGWAARLWGQVPRRGGHRPCIWFHAVSVGEVHLLRPLVGRVAAELPDWECVVSTTSQTGFALARDRFPSHQVFYCPLDFSWSVRRAVRRIRPDLLVLVELELWPNLIAAARDSGARVAIVNGRLGDRSFSRYLRIRRWLAPTLERLDAVLARGPLDAERFLALGAGGAAVHVTGSLKFDGCETRRDNTATRRLAALAGITSQDRVFVAGSTQAPEEQLALDAFRELADRWPQLRLLVVPRHPQRFGEVAQLLDRSGLRWQRRTALEDHGPDPAARILLVDTIGELAGWWGLAEIAYVGGSMGARGGQNMIEPAAYGAAVAFGPRTENFRDVVELLLADDAAVVVPDGAALTQLVRRCLEQPDWARELGARARRLVLAQQGATDRTLQRLVRLPGNPHGTSHGSPVSPTKLLAFSHVPTRG